MSKIEANESGVMVRPSPDQMTAWARSAADKPIGEWLEAVADEAAAEIGDRAWPVVVTLAHPVEFGSQRITSLELRRGRAGDVKDMKLSGELPTAHLILIVSRLSGQPTQVIERLDVDDAGEVMAIALDFYGRFLGGGRTRSR